MKLRWTNAARRDREVIYVYVEADNPDAALRLDERFRDRAAQLTGLPYLGRAGRVPGTRELTIAGSSYVLVYRVEPGLVSIIRVIHTARTWPEDDGA
ncbi:type II toxin-antitoxin system RelE/ParE family toxin [Devosia beringensis]|uniref:type II toxin-antitoxin system RelE/ParE family toxin n=1 Tax=Devosia beringensis TaxID=2657486 RepID=UPI00186B7058|nr:type II toxin-antitoxin system RelE/ParE family toxin [Devosia beringensis]